ncbi:low molecular weight protein-tyrosine-phosphatase [Spirochaeta isovalerica]|uniref:Protein-tyrosine phosphatase n=1 Tax=Spirochaeta isovalerica TaxID=150 RepID=A0A841RF58_9SPIO|nr:low molecular weight protein-tyrosine-phosphatase [Spirochaeta isovalerica]MBB6481630.1 protein-tyrosine phosphatase [Spirochaeta isovalerica]
MSVKRVMFVCLGNICRSPLAHAVFQEIVNQRGLTDQYEIQSSGTCAYHVGEPSDSRMKKTALDHGVKIKHRARQIFRYDLEDYDYIFAMDHNNFNNLKRLTANEGLLARIRMFRDYDPEGPGDVPDPYYGGQEGFENVFTIVQRTCDHILDLMESGEL